MNHIVAPENCVGCALCANLCPKDAITMVWNKYGFLEPEVNTEACINCGMCLRQCPALEESEQAEKAENHPIAYGAWMKDEDILQQSSSGGIFTALARSVLNEGGIIFGVVWQTPDTAVFTSAETEEELAAMRGSKYVPAIVGKIYRQVKHELKKNRRVLFTGTPCQVYALKKYLKTIPENLLTVDIVCHGTPSRLILQKYIQEEETKQNKKAIKISMREKPEGWYQGYSHVAIYYSDGSRCGYRANVDSFYQLFMSDTMLNTNCYRCPHRTTSRPGDISICDYWGVANYHPDWPLAQGISGVLVNSERGAEAVESIKEQLIIHPTKSQHIMNRQCPEVLPYPVNRELIFNTLRNGSLKDTKLIACHTKAKRLEREINKMRRKQMRYYLISFILFGKAKTKYREKRKKILQRMANTQIRLDALKN